jgi:hypothetical protein
MPKDVEKVLEAWRRAEQRLAAVPEGSPEHAEAEADAGQWRARYQSLVNGSASTDASEPPLDAGPA